MAAFRGRSLPRVCPLKIVLGAAEDGWLGADAAVSARSLCCSSPCALTSSPSGKALGPVLLSPPDKLLPACGDPSIEIPGTPALRGGGGSEGRLSGRYAVAVCIWRVANVRRHLNDVVGQGRPFDCRVADLVAAEVACATTPTKSSLERKPRIRDIAQRSKTLWRCRMHGFLSMRVKNCGLVRYCLSLPIFGPTRLTGSSTVGLRDRVSGITG